MKNIKIQKFISILIIISIISISSFFPPKKANAFLGVGDITLDSVSNILSAIGKAIYQAGSFVVQKAGVAAEFLTASLTGKEWYKQVYEEVLRAIARRALQEITKSTVNWINSGFHGSPLFLENPQSFFNDIAKSEVKNLVDTFGYDRLKFPFGKEFALNTISSYKQTLEKNTAYSLSNVIKDQTVLNNYRNDWNFGGWNAFLVNTQYPQNNYLGFQMTATEELARRVQGTTQTAVKKVQDTLQQGQGFLSPQTCPSNPAYNNGVNEFQKPQFNMAEYDKKNPFNPPPGGTQAQNEAYTNEYNDRLRQAKEDWAKDNSCPGQLVNTTPGSVVSNQITTAMGSQFRQSELGAAMGNSLSAIFDALLNKFLSDGLNSLASNKNAAPVDNWSYDGQTLGSPSDSDWASGPDQEIILRDFKILIDGKTLVTFKKGQQLFDEDGNLKVYGAGTPILCKDGDKIVDADGNTIEECTRGEVISCNVGEKIVAKDNTSINCIETTDGIQRHSSDPVHLDPVLAEGGELVTLVGDKSLDRLGNLIDGREYFAGGLENTIQELALMNNPCEPNDEECINNPLETTINPKNGNMVYKYKPGIMQFVNPVIQSTKTLDECIPGPDKGWEARLNAERDVNISKFGTKMGGDGDPLKIRAGNDGIKELKFAVDAFRDWINVHMAASLRGAMVYLDNVSDVDNVAQLSKDTSNAAREKGQTLARLQVIKTALEAFTEQPAPNTGLEKSLVSLKKQYDAIRTSVSSINSIEDTKNQLNTLKDKIVNLESLNNKCTVERVDAGWTKEREVEELCKIPIVSGYSHGTVIRNDEAARHTNCPDITNSISCANQGGSDVAPESWFTFRNPSAVGTPATIPPSGYDLGNPGYKDLPMVNASEVFGDNGGGIDRVSIKIDCKLIFKAKITDYTQAGNPSL